MRITPAYAGKRSASRGHVETVRDHPRLCGEKSFSLILNICGSGSPPPMRGKETVHSLLVHYSQDHPRLCGEKVILNRFTAFTIGSPPPMRGKVYPICENSILHRITPAYAGKRWGVLVFLSFCQDHPRLCGEKNKNGVKIWIF